MTGNRIKSGLLVAALMGAMACPAGYAARAEGPKIAAAGTGTASASELSSLEQAHGILAKADHDYKGHRVKAMHAINEAAKELGGKSFGDGKAKVSQAISDADLRQAKSLLEGVLGGSGGKHVKAKGHIEHAIKELDEALAIK